MGSTLDFRTSNLDSIPNTHSKFHMPFDQFRCSSTERNTTTTDLITALQTHGELHKGTDLGGVLQWAILHIQSQAEAIEELREEATGEMNERVRLEGLLHTVKGVIEAAMQAVETWENKPIDFSRDLAGHINLMACHGDSDYLKSNGQSIRHIDLRETATGKPKKDKKPHEKNN